MKQTESNKAHWDKCAEYVEVYATLADEIIQNGKGLAFLFEKDILTMIKKAK
jgi:hypothetical protein